MYMCVCVYLCICGLCFSHCAHNICRNNAVSQVLLAPGSTVVTGLMPYMFYNVHVDACTQFGCTSSPGVLVTTLESRTSVTCMLCEGGVAY